MPTPNKPIKRALAVVVAALTMWWVPAPRVRADERIHLSEILPALQGTELGNVDLGAAPNPGVTRTITRADVLGALKREGKETQGLAIPRSTRISRELRLLGRQEATTLATQALSEALAPCEVTSVTLPEQIRVTAGRLTARADTAPRQPGATSSSSSIVFTSGTHETRVSVHARLSCPPPVISAGSRVTLVARSGAVRATAPGEARQAGAIGDVIRVTNTISNTQLTGRVLNAETVEVLR